MSVAGRELDGVDASIMSPQISLIEAAGCLHTGIDQPVGKRDRTPPTRQTAALGEATNKR